MENLARDLRKQVPSLKITASKLYSLRTYGKDFSVKSIKTLMTLAKNHKIILTRSHFLHSLSVTPQSERFEFIVTCIKKRMSSQQLLEAKLKKYSKSELIPVGRKPKTLLAILKRFTQLAEAYSQKSEKLTSDGVKLLSEYKRNPRKNSRVERELQKVADSHKQLQHQVHEVQRMVRAKF